MIDSTQIEKEIDAAIEASTLVLTYLHENDWEKAEKANQRRMGLVRLLSKCQKNLPMWQKFDDKINQIKHLDKEIVRQGKDKHSQMLLQMCDNYFKTNVCIEYAQHK